MAAILTLDTIEGAQLQADFTGKYRVRTGTVEGIDVVGNPDSAVLDKALDAQGMPQLGSTDPIYPLTLLSKVGVFPISNDAVRVRLEYAPINFGATTAYIFTDGTSLVNELTSIHPTAGAVRVGLNKTYNDVIIPDQTLTFDVPRPCRQISINAYLVGQPAQQPNLVGNVNSDTWPVGANPLASGYWLMSEYKTSLSKWSGWYSLTASAISKTFENWMMRGAIIDPSTGKFVAPSQNGAVAGGYNAAVQQFASIPYAYGVTSAPQLGLASVGWFPMTAFAAAFGFGGSNIFGS